jgi:hypothetical protein
MKKKLGVIVPYRHREQHLPIFIDSISEYLTKKEIPFELIIIEQDDAKQFNRGMLLNIGFVYAKKYGCRYVVFHDVDMLPVDVDYSYDDKPIHLATNIEKEDENIFDEYFGGVTMFSVKDFKEIDGFSNKYWDWGYEDTDLLHRVKKHKLELDTLHVQNVGNPSKALKFNGINSFVRGKNNFDLTKGNYTIFISFCPEDIFCDFTKDVDYYTTFSIPGYDTSISFNSFSRYNFLTFDSKENAIHIDSKIKTNYKTNIIVTIDNDNKCVEMYQDGIKLGEVEFKGELRPYYDERYFYIGVGKPNRVGDERFFKGSITSFAIIEDKLTSEEIDTLSNTEKITNNNLLVHYDANNIDGYTLTDLSGKGNDGKIENCEIIDLSFEKYKKVSIPHRRKSLFRSLKHEKNGYDNNGWKNKAIRWNQLRFHNEVYLNDDLIDNDGLSTLSFVEHGLNRIKDNISIITVGI